jgi:excisionase family DNA binding protein
MNIRVNLTKRVKIAGISRFCPVVFSAEGRVKPNWVLVGDKEQEHLDGSYYLDLTEKGKRKRLSIGSDAYQAVILLQQKQMELKANALRDASRHSTTVSATGSHEGTKPTTVLSLQECLAEYRRALTVKDISDLFSIDDETVYEQAKKGTIPSFRIGTAVRFDPKAISDWLKQQ